MYRLFASLALVTLLVAPELGCKSGQERAEAKQAIEAFKPKVQALEAALDSAPTKAEGYRLPEGESLRLCWGGCEDGEVANARLIPELAKELERLDQLVAALDQNPKPYTLDYALEHEIPNMPNVRYLAVKIEEDVIPYDIDTPEKRARWVGRVAVWDSQANEWIGAVRVNLRAEELKFNFYEMVDSRGNTVSGPFRDEEGDKKGAQSEFDQLVRQAFPVAVESGKDITRFDQIARAKVEAEQAAVAVQGDAMIFRGSGGVLVALTDQGFADLGLADVTNVWPAPTGFVFTLAKNKLPPDTPYIKRMHEGMIEDMSFSTERFRLELLPVDHQGDPWLRTSTLKKEEGKEPSAEIAQWVDDDWHVTSLEALTPKVRWVDALGHSAGGSTQVVLGGGAVHIGSGANWRSLELDQLGSQLVVEPDGNVLVGTRKGLFRVTVGEELESERLAKGIVKKLHPIAGGKSVAVLEGRFPNPDSFVLVEGAKATKIKGIKGREHGVGPEGTIAAYNNDALYVRTPSGEITRYPASGSLPFRIYELEVDGSGRVWGRSDKKLLIVIADGQLLEIGVGKGGAIASGVTDISPMGLGAAPVDFVPVVIP